MLKIDHLRLALPAGYAPRARQIAFLIAAELADRLPRLPGSPMEPMRLDRLALPPINVAHGASDHEVAGSVANAIASALSSGTGSR
jgi:hypothetical protein